MPSHRGSTFRVLATLVASAVTAAAPGACGGVIGGSPGDGGNGDESDATGAGSSSGESGPNGDDASSSSGGDDADGSSSGTVTGSSSSPPCPAATTTYPVDAAVCEPQLQEIVTLYDAACQWNIEVPCSAEGGTGDAGAADAASACAVCAPYIDADLANSCFSTTGAEGVQTIVCGTCCIGGRAPRGFAPRDSRSPSAAGAHLARMAQLEAASVDAFHALHADLARARAPRDLLAGVRAAARDEVRHARDVGRAARRFGARVPRARVRAIEPRSLEQLATENAEQGCVEETFGAAIVAVQARHAEDPTVRRLMRTIAREELRHAALAWDVARWLEGKLDADARDRVRNARLTALRKLEKSVATGSVGDRALGLPGAMAARAMLRRMWLPIASGELTQRRRRRPGVGGARRRPVSRPRTACRSRSHRTSAPQSPSRPRGCRTSARTA